MTQQRTSIILQISTIRVGRCSWSRTDRTPSRVAGGRRGSTPRPTPPTGSQRSDWRGADSSSTAILIFNNRLFSKPPHIQKITLLMPPLIYCILFTMLFFFPHRKLPVLFWQTTRVLLDSTFPFLFIWKGSFYSTPMIKLVQRRTLQKYTWHVSLYDLFLGTTTSSSSLVYTTGSHWTLLYIRMGNLIVQKSPKRSHHLTGKGLIKIFLLIVTP